MMRRRGYLLIEMVVALGVFGAAVLGGAQMVLHYHSKIRHAAQSETALSTLENEIELVRAGERGAISGQQPFTIAIPETLPEAQGQVTIQPFDGVPRLWSVTAELTWTGDNGRRITKTLTTCIAAARGAS